MGWASEALNIALGAAAEEPCTADHLSPSRSLVYPHKLTQHTSAATKTRLAFQNDASCQHDAGS